MNCSIPRRRRRKYRRYPFLVDHILALVKYYSTLTVRFLFYLLVSRYPSLYPNDRRTYKLVVSRSTKLRRQDAALNAKFIDPSRYFIVQRRSYHGAELWLEKGSLRPMVEPLARLYGVNVLVLRGFGSLSAITMALQRAIRRGIRLILYIGDHDPSGLEIEEVSQREMRIRFKRVMVTRGQAESLKLTAMPTNKRDSRWRKYTQEFGDKAWEVEAIRPRTFRRILGTALGEAVPEEFLGRMELEKKAAAIARPITTTLVRRIESDVRRWLRVGVPEEEIRRRLREKYGLYGVGGAK